jgi:hypothetical protein
MFLFTQIIVKSLRTGLFFPTSEQVERILATQQLVGDAYCGFYDMVPLPS